MIHLTDKGRWAARNPDRVCWNCGAFDLHQTDECPICGDEVIVPSAGGFVGYCGLPVGHDGVHSETKDGPA